jgi:hypothetical protein
MTGVRELLERLGEGRIRDAEELGRSLALCWDELEGSDDGGMQAYKLMGRMEAADWHPPVLTFRIERHGGTVLGSPRAELQCWKVNFDAGTAETRRRQLYEMEPRFTTKRMRAEAEELAVLIAAGQEDARLRWRRDGRVHVNLSEIIGYACRQTDSGRRRRMRGVLEDVLGGRGCGHDGGNVFSKPVIATAR